jgi:iron complex transport system substrate-binding protein
MVLRRWILIATAVVAFGGSYVLRRAFRDRWEAPPAPSQGAVRIVSVAPSITEVLFELGLGERVVGVTRYCVFPPEARLKPQIGGYYDPNFEAITAAKPDLVITLKEHEEVRKELAKLGFPSITVDHSSVPGILSSVLEIGRACGCSEKAAEVHRRLESRLRDLGKRTQGKTRPRVLISIGRMAGDSSLGRVTICGRKGFFEELIGLAGGENAFEGEIPFPTLSAEGILQCHPDLIIDLWPDLKEKGLDPEEVRRQWKGIPGLQARIVVIGENYVMIPGPRIVLLLDDLARAIHPEASHD